MIFTIARPARILAPLAVAGLLVSGCGSGPSQVGSAAIVGDTAIPLATIQQQLDAAMRKPGVGDRMRERRAVDDTARELVGFAVQHELVTRTAREEGLHVNAQQVDAALAQQGGAHTVAGQTPLDESGVRRVMRDQLLMAELGRRHAATDAVTIDYTQATKRSAAEAKARRMARGPEQARGVVRADRAAGQPAVLGANLNGADSPELMAATPLFAASRGTVLAFPVRGQGSGGVWLVGRVTDRIQHPPQSTPALAGVDAASYREIGRLLLDRTGQRVGVRVSPRYGVWDPLGMQPAPSAGEASGIQIDPESKQVD